MKIMEMSRICAAAVPAPAAAVAAPVPVAEKKAKVPSKALGQATAWGDFTKKVCAEQAEALAAFKAAAESKAGVMPKFMAVYRKSNPDEWTSFQEQWLVAHPKATAEVSAPAPKPKKVKKAKVVPDGEKLWHSDLNGQDLRDIYHAIIGKAAGLKDSGKFTTKTVLIAEIERLRADKGATAPEVPVTAPEPKPKKVLSPEHLAKMKAGREAFALAKKAAAAAGGEVPVKPERMLLPILERSPSPKESKEKED